MSPINIRWKVAGAVAAVAALGIASTGLPSGSTDVSLPDAINLRDRVPVSEAAQEQPAPSFEVMPLRLAGDSFDSPFNSPASGAPAAMDTATTDSPDAPVSDQIAPLDTASVDSPDATVSDQTAPVLSGDDSVTADSPDSFDSAGLSS